MALIALAFGFFAGPAKASEWVMLGTRTVGDSVDHDTIRVTSARGDFRRLKLKVTRHAVRFYRLSVIYGNGNPDQLDLRSSIPAGGETRQIDLRGGNRVIRRIDLWYETKSLGRQRAEVYAFGIR